MALHIPDFLYPVGDHTQITPGVATPLTRPTDATHLIIQAFDQVNIRVVLDGTNPATATFGFRITAADEPAVFPVAVATISICPEAAVGNVHYQWLTRYRAGGG